jgi:hypothetical protein
MHLEVSDVSPAVAVRTRSFAVDLIILKITLVYVAVAEFKHLQRQESQRHFHTLLNFGGKLHPITSLLAVNPIAVVQFSTAVCVGPLSMSPVLQPRSGVLVAVAVDASASSTCTVVCPFAAVHVAVVEEVGAVAVLLI